MIYIFLCITCHLFSISWVLFTCLMQRRRFCLLIMHFKMIILNYCFTSGSDLKECRKTNRKKTYILFYFYFYWVVFPSRCLGLVFCAFPGQKHSWANANFLSRVQLRGLSQKEANHQMLPGLNKLICYIRSLSCPENPSLPFHLSPSLSPWSRKILP